MNPLPQDYSEEGAAAQLAAKRERLMEMLRPFAAPEPEVHASAAIHFRQRAEFRIWHENEATHYLMFGGKDSQEPMRLAQFPTASRRINALMEELATELAQIPVLRHRLWQVEFLDTLAGESLITLVYHRKLDAQWQSAATEASARLDAAIVGRSRGQRLVIGRDWVTERLPVNGRSLEYRQPEGSFTQPNATVNSAMLAWAQRACAGEPERDLLELYCGIGNFTVAVAGCFRRVLATEIGAGAISAAQHNLAANDIHNTFVARLSSAEAASAMARERPFRRLRSFDLEDFRPEVLLIDPPRAGMDEDTRALAAGFNRIVYVSCNPATLCRDIEALGSAYRLRHTALFDQFPYTPHMECGVVLERQHPGATS
jgi:tRNA (uracil-5-)-methyltransferase